VGSIKFEISHQQFRTPDTVIVNTTPSVSFIETCWKQFDRDDIQIRSDSQCIGPRRRRESPDVQRSLHISVFSCRKWTFKWPKEFSEIIAFEFVHIGTVFLFRCRGRFGALELPKSEFAVSIHESRLRLGKRAGSRCFQNRPIANVGCWIEEHLESRVSLWHIFLRFNSTQTAGRVECRVDGQVLLSVVLFDEIIRGIKYLGKTNSIRCSNLAAISSNFLHRHICSFRRSIKISPHHHPRQSHGQWAWGTT